MKKPIAILALLIVITLAWCGISARLRGTDIVAGIAGGVLGCALAVAAGDWIARKAMQ